MPKINYNNRLFAPVSNSESGEVSSNTVFEYHQQGDVVWAEYRGGDVVFGNLIAKAQPDGSLDMRYPHVNRKGALMTGVCESTPEVLKDGRIRLHEKWRWTSGDNSQGESVIEEVSGKGV